MTVRYFAGAKAAAGTATERLTTPVGTTIDDLVTAIAADHGEALTRVLAAASFLLDGTAVHARDEGSPTARPSTCCRPSRAADRPSDRRVRCHTPGPRGVLPDMTVVHDTRIGPLHLDASDDGLTLVGFTEPTASSGTGPRAVLDLARREIDAYLDGTLRAFTVPVDLAALPEAHRRVLRGLDDVGWGATITYGDLARKVGLPVTDSRRVGGAMARNPVAIVVPCHRVVGADGSSPATPGASEAKGYCSTSRPPTPCSSDPVPVPHSRWAPSGSPGSRCV